MSRTSLGQVGVPAAIVFVVVMMVVPPPAAAIDLLIVANLAAAVVVLLISMYVRRPLDFSVFPSLLLVLTLFRLALNVSTVRLVLLDGYAGEVIDSFGHFVIGGSLIVGLVVFFILVVIQFVVITNGASRVAEVGARFTLDAMPGKQMAIDADLSSGLISETEAKKRRREVAAEADFYGAMDGASKFVKGDAVAAIVITFINLVGGFIMGLQRGLTVSESIQSYSLLTVGDGLVSQIPALLISVASGLIVTRAADENDMGTQLMMQVAAHRRALRIGGGSLLAMVLLPGMPKVPFLVIGTILVVAANRQRLQESVEEVEAVPVVTPDSPEAIVHEMRVEPLELELGYGVVDLVDTARDGDLLARVRALRRTIALELGIVIPPVRTRDSIDLPTDSYSIKVNGVPTAKGEAPTGMVLVLGTPPPGLPCRPTHDPVFGLEAAWVASDLAVHAELNGATVVDRGSVITAHLAEVVRSHAARLLSRQDVKALIDTVKAANPVLVDELATAGLSLATVQTVLHNLLEEQVPVRDLVRILEAMSARATVTKDPEQLTEAARVALGGAIGTTCAQHGTLPVLTLEPLLEQALLEAVRPGDGGTVLAVDHETAERLLASARERVHAAEEHGHRPALVCSPPIRAALRRLTRNLLPSLPVLSYLEVGEQLTIETVGVVSLAASTV